MKYVVNLAIALVFGLLMVSFSSCGGTYYGGVYPYYGPPVGGPYWGPYPGRYYHYRPGPGPRPPRPPSPVRPTQLPARR